MSSEDEAFQNFEDEIRAILSSLDRNTAAISQWRGDATQQRSFTDAADQDVKDARAAFQRMEQEVRHFSYSVRSKAQQRLGAMNSELDQAVRKLQQAKSQNFAPSDFPSGHSRAEQDRYRENRRRLLDAKQTVDESGESIDRTIAILDDTLDRGVNTTATLQEQTEQIRHARDTIQETDDILTKSAKLLRRMRRRVVTNKIIQFFIVLVEIALCALIVWLKWLRD